MHRRANTFRRPWHLYLLAAAAAALIVLGITQIGPPTSSARVSREVEEAVNGVVQSTVSGTGNVEAATDETVNFATSGTLQSVYVSVGEHVHKGQLLATLDPSSAELSLKEAKASLAAAEDNLKAAEDGTSSSSGDSDATSLDDVSDTTEFVDYTTANTTTTSTTTTPATTTTTTTTPTTTTPTEPKSKSGKGKTKPGSSTTGSTTGTTGAGSTGTGSTGTGSTGTGSTGSTGTTTTSASEIASAKASVDSAKASVDSAKEALSETKLYAPASGTIASLESVSPGQSISSSSSSSDTGSSSTSTTGSNSTGTTAGSLGSSSSSSSSSGFATIINSGTLTMTVAFSESDISSVKVGQAATISMDALSGVELGAHVTSISPLATTSDDVVSYDATLTLDQTNPKVRSGMSASATVITAQAQGVTVPTDAISGSGSNGTVQVQENGKTVTKQVVVGLRGSSRAVILSGLRAGQDVVVTVTLPALGTSSTTSSSSSTGTLGSGFFRRGLGGGGAFPTGGGSFPGGGFSGGG